MQFYPAPRSSLLFATGAIMLAVCVSPTAAHAQDVDGGVYITGRIGIALPSDFNLDGVQDPQAPSPGASGAPANVDVELDSDITFSGAIGYKIPTRFFGFIEPNLELEYNYTNVDVSGGSFNAGTQTFLGDVEVQTFTLNYQGDLVFSENQRVIPFLGSGIGIADVESNVRYFPGTATAPTFGVIESGTAFTYFSNIGVRFDVTDKISLDVRARYQRIDGVDLERRFVASGNDAFNADVSGDYETVNFLAGVRYRF